MRKTNLTGTDRSGGCVISGVADRVSDLIGTLVYLDGFVPETDQPQNWSLITTSLSSVVIISFVTQPPNMRTDFTPR
jgi:hypothetical protein